MEVEQEEPATPVCKFFIETGICTLGANCRLLHDREQFRRKEMNDANEVNDDDDMKGEFNKEDLTEICFSFDTTGSMYKWLSEVKTKLEEIVTSLFEKISNIRISFIAHGDYCDEGSTYVIKHIDFSSDADKLIKWIKDTGSTGGGDWPECYEFVLYTAARFKWSRFAKNKALVLIGDATPHSPDEEQNKLSIDWREELDRISMKGIKIYSIHCGGEEKSKYFYQTIAKRTGGRYLTLANMKNICDMFVALCLRSSDQEKFEQFSEQLISTQNVDKELENALKELKTKDSNASAVKRLMKDFKELQTEDLSNISCIPDSKDIFKWHVNIKPLQGALQNVYIHLILKFPSQYPSRPPDINLYSYFVNDIHPNIMDNGICMDVLRSNVGIDGGKGHKYGGWSAAYTITSLLINIASLFSDIITNEQYQRILKEKRLREREEEKNRDNLNDASIEDFSPKNKFRRSRPRDKKRKKERNLWSECHYLSQYEMDDLIKRIRQTECECGHAPFTPFPALSSDISPINIVCDQNEGDEMGVFIAGTVIQTKIENEYWKIQSLFGIQLHHQCVAWQFTLDWFDIDCPSSQSGFFMGFSDNTGNFFGINYCGHRIYHNVIDDSIKVFEKKLKQTDTVSLILYLNDNIEESNRVLIAINNEYVSNVIIPDYYNQIEKYYPTMFLKNIRIKIQFEENAVLNALPSTYNLPIKQVKMISQLPEVTGFTKIDKKRHFYVSQEQWNLLLQKTLSADVVLLICNYLIYEDISRCKQLNTHWFQTIDSYLVLERLSYHCYFTGDTWNNDILGVGFYIEYQETDRAITYSMGDNNEIDIDMTDSTDYAFFNTRKGTSNIGQYTSSWINVAKSEMDLLSLTAWNEFKVRQGAWGEQLTHWIPLIINDKHAQKAKSVIVDRITKLTNTESFSEETALIGIAALMSQFVVQLMGDVDVDETNIDIKHASEKALTGYCGIHHLLLYIAYQYPLMRLIALKNVTSFIDNRKKRRKSNTPDLGKFLINLSIIDDEAYQKLDLDKLWKAFIDESLDRSVKWYLQKYPSLENLSTEINEYDNDEYQARIFTDKERLKTVFKATQTGRRLILFQYWFTRNIARPKNKKLIEILIDYNAKWGKPTDSQKRKLMRCVKDILNKKTDYSKYDWKNYFNDLGLSNYQCFQKDEEIVKILKENVVRSQLKGYHKKNRLLSDKSEYKNISRDLHEFEQKQTELLNDCPVLGPMSRLKYMMETQKDVLLVMRATEGQFKKVVGKIRTFDRHWNMILLNPKEYWQKQICFSKNNPIYIKQDRHIGKFVFVRGDDIVLIQIIGSEKDENKEDARDSDQDLIDID